MVIVLGHYDDKRESDMKDDRNSFWCDISQISAIIIQLCFENKNIIILIYSNSTNYI